MNEFHLFFPLNCVEVAIYLRFYSPTAQIQLNTYYASHWKFCVILRVAQISAVHVQRNERRPHCQECRALPRIYVNLKLPALRGFCLKSVAINALSVAPTNNSSAFDMATGDPCIFYNILIKQCVLAHFSLQINLSHTAVMVQLDLIHCAISTSYYTALLFTPYN
jgi:hypothetical protein